MAALWLAAAALVLAACGGQSSGNRGVTSAARPAADRGADGLVAIQTITYRSSFDASNVTALVATPRGGSSRGCVIWQYGLGSTKQDSSRVWQSLALLGLTTVSIDLRDHGARATSPTQLQQVIRDPSSIARMIRGTVADLHSAIDYLEKQPYCWRNVAYAGVSLGGIIGTLLAATDHRVKAAVIMSTPATFRDVLTTPGDPLAPGLADQPAKLAAALRILAPLDPARYIGQISPRPVMILGGLQDRTVTAPDWGALEAAAREPKTILNYRGGHDPTSGPAAAANGQAIASFLLRYVVEPTYGFPAHAGGTFLEQ